MWAQSRDVPEVKPPTYTMGRIRRAGGCPATGRGCHRSSIGVSGIVYDAGVLIAAERTDRTLWADHRVRLEQGTIPVTPAAVVAQVSRSSRQAQLRRLLRGCDVAELDENTAHRVGRILAQACTSDVVDGAVVAAAMVRFAAVLTSDRADIVHLLQSTGTDTPAIFYLNGDPPEGPYGTDVGDADHAGARTLRAARAVNAGETWKPSMWSSRRRHWTSRR